eukprot:4976033-Alexandrium_andersonii.AAC.1
MAQPGSGPTYARGRRAQPPAGPHTNRAGRLGCQLSQPLPPARTQGLLAGLAAGTDRCLLEQLG